MINRKQLSTIFYIYSNASVAVMMAIGAVTELICGLVLQFAYANPLCLLCYGATVAFTLITLSLVLGVYRSAKTHRII